MLVSTSHVLVLARNVTRFEAVSISWGMAVAAYS